jgi:hypothetical protein
VTVLRTSHPLAFIAREYTAGSHCFDRQRLEQALSQALDTRAAADRLAAAGIALIGVDGPVLELRPADPRVARLVNRARLGPQYRGYNVHKVIEAILYLPPKAKRRRAVTDDRRLKAALVLQDGWLIDCEDLLEGRLFVRLSSRWTLPPAY